MLTFMDYIVHAFGTSTDWNHDNSYSSLTATSDALLSFPTPSSLSLRVSSLSTPQFATSYTLSTLGQIDGSISYLYSSVPLGHVPSRTVSIPLRTLVRGYRDVKLPSIQLNSYDDSEARKPILLHGTLALPPPSNLTALYARRINSKTLLSLSLNSLSTSTPPTGSGPPPASVLGHIQHDTGQYSIEGLASSDSALLGVRGLWNFGLGPSKQSVDASADNGHKALEDVGGITSPAESLPNERVMAKPSLLSAGAEAYYSPLSSVIGLSTGLRFTTLAPHNSTPAVASTPSSSKPLAGTSAALSSALVAPANVAHSSFPYTLTLTLTPLTGSLASTYSVRPTEDLALSSRFGFNVYSWESEYVLGAEIWRRRRKRLPKAGTDPDPLAWARDKAAEWLTDAQRALEREKVDREEENVIKLRIDDGWNIRALWTGRVKQLLVSAGVSVAPTSSTSYRYQVSGVGGGTIAGGGMEKRWKGSVGIEVAYSS
jgi:mitochondrial distribution and morphology protein 10